MEILKLITKQPEITNEQLKAYYHCHDEQLVEKLLDFLEEESRTFPFYEKDVSTKYLYYTLLRIDDAYEKILDEGKLKLPFRSRYQEIQNEVYRCTRGNLHHDGETVSRVYRLNNEYKTLKAMIVRGPDWDSDFNGEIVIYGDDKELYRSGKITKTGELKSEINIDVTDVDDLKIEFVTESEPDGWANFYIYLVEPYLYK